MGFALLNLVVLVVSVLALNEILLGVQPRVVNLLLLSELPVLEDKIKSSQFPEFLIPLVKKKDLATDLAISKMEIEQVSIPKIDTRVSFSNSEDIIFQSSNITLNLKFFWKIQSHHKQGVLDSGYATVLLEKSSILLMAQLTENMQQMLKPIKSEFAIGDLEVTFEKTPMKDLINWGLSQIKEKVAHTIEVSLNSALSLRFNQYIKSLTSLSSENLIDIRPWLLLNATLTELPSIDEDSFSVFFDGTFKHKTKDSEMPESIPILMEYKSKRQIALYLSELSANSLSLAYFQYSPFSISNQELGVRLTTNLIEILFPNITSTFGENVAVDVVCTQINYLVLGLEKKVLNIQQKFSCSVQCQTGKIGVFSIDLKAGIEAEASSGIIRGKFLNILIDDLIALEFYSEESPDLLEIKSFLNGVLNFAKPIISFKVFGSGILIPSSFIKHFEQFQVTIEESHLIIEGDLSSDNN